MCKPVSRYGREGRRSRPKVAAVEPGEPGEVEDVVEWFLFNFGTPVPGAGETTVDARAGVEEIVGAAAVETVSNEIAENVFLTRLDASKGGVDVGFDSGIFGEPRKLLDDEHDWIEYPAHLAVLVQKHQRVRNVVVAQMHDAAADPTAELALTRGEDVIHRFADAWCLLDAV